MCLLCQHLALVSTQHMSLVATEHNKTCRSTAPWRPLCYSQMAWHVTLLETLSLLRPMVTPSGIVVTRLRLRLRLRLAEDPKSRCWFEGASYFGSSLVAGTSTNGDSISFSLIMAHWPRAASAASVAQPADESAERRYARDGKAYTLKEFVLYYGERYGRAIWDKSPCLDKAEQPVPKAAPKSSATRPVHEESITWHLEDIVNSTFKEKLQVSRDNVTMALATIL